MKKILFLFMLAICMAYNADAQVAKIMVKNGSNAKFYDKDELTTAVANAVNGDTIIFTEGLFKGDVTIEKELTLIGAGQGTIINGNINLKLGGDQNLESRYLDALLISGKISIQSNVKNLSLRKIKFESFSINTNCKIGNLIVDRCDLQTFGGAPEYYANAMFINSSIQDITHSCENVQFLNCYMKQIGNSAYFLGTAVNSIIQTYYYYRPSLGSSFMNCLIGSSINLSQAFTENCYILSYDEIEKLYSDSDALYNGGFLGNDGTVVGYLGGQTPYSLVPSGPKITNMELKIDADNNQLKVSASGSVN